MLTNLKGRLKRGMLLGCFGAVLTAGVGCDMLNAVEAYFDRGERTIERLRSVDDDQGDREKVRERHRLRRY